MGHASLRRGRLSLPRQIFLVTTVTHNREPVFCEFAHARLLIAELRRLHDSAAVCSLAWVVMPDHLHWLVGLGHSHSISIVVKMLKGRTAHALNRGSARQGPVWQRAYFDHAVRADEDLSTVARYIVANPLRAGLVRRIGDYPHWDAAWL